MLKWLFILSGWVLFVSPSFGNTLADKREMEAHRVKQAPRIDGRLDEECWTNSLQKTYFYQYQPDNGKPSAYATAVSFVYDDKAIYVAAKLYDPHPEKINKELGVRDDESRNTDLFGITIDTYNNGQNAFRFIVTSAGVQADAFLSNNGYDYQWDGVWKSVVTMDEEGWNVEIEIPYYNLRFPKQEVQQWSINFHRRIQRLQELSYWNHVDNSVRGVINQSGVLKGVEAIDPPFRLNFSPYLTSVYTSDQLKNRNSSQITAGMDLKYGINESFTLDMSLIPDFSQVQSDNVVLNLSAFEVRFSENRPFFTEGTELFNRGGLFYSRRVGETRGRLPTGTLLENEEIVSVPGATPLMNATKISGRTKKGTGIGFFNAITNRSFAKIKNTESNTYREVEVDPLTNFNVLVVDQNLPYNSNVALINTNVTRAGDARDANVTALDFHFYDKQNRYRLGGFGGLSQRMSHVEGLRQNQLGHRLYVHANKVSGNLQWGVGKKVETHTYNINDMGYMSRANDIHHYANVRYLVFKPQGIFNRWNTRLGYSHHQLYEPRAFTNANINWDGWGQLRNFWETSLHLGVNPTDTYDFFEPREEGWVFVKPGSFNYNARVSTDRRKPLHLNTSAGQWYRPEWNQRDQWLSTSLRMRASDKLSFNYSVEYSLGERDRGYVKKAYSEANPATLDHVVIGQREVKTTTNVLGASLTFNNKMGLNLRIRHYWRKVDYNEFFNLSKEGYLATGTHTGQDELGNPLHDLNYNAFNVDMVYSWQIAPGSFLNVVWKDSILNTGKDTGMNFFRNFEHTLGSPQINSLSVRLTYFLDYLHLRNTI
jgi:hypothetical protein